MARATECLHEYVPSSTVDNADVVATLDSVCGLIRFYSASALMEVELAMGPGVETGRKLQDTNRLGGSENIHNSKTLGVSHADTFAHVPGLIDSAVSPLKVRFNFINPYFFELLCEAVQRRHQHINRCVRADGSRKRIELEEEIFLELERLRHGILFARQCR